jgi:hypothetical protein
VLVVVGERGGRFDGVDADDRAAEPLLVGADLGGQVGKGGLAAELAAQHLAGGFELAALPPDPARPRVLAQRVNHGAADAALRESLELDAPSLVEAVRRVDQSDDSVLDEVADVDRVGHRGRHATGELLDERDSVDHPRVLFDC